MSFWDNAVDGFKSGLMGKGPNYVKKERAKRALALRQRLEGRWFTKYREGIGTIELLIDPEGNLTNTYPHLHVIHDERVGEVRFIASTSHGQRVYANTLHGDVSGNEVNAEIERALRELRRHI